MKRQPSKPKLSAAERRFLCAAAKAADLDTEEFETAAVASNIGLADDKPMRDRLSTLGLLIKGKTPALDRLSEEGWDVVYRMVVKAPGVSKAALDAAISAESDRLLARNPNLLATRREKGPSAR